MGVLSETLSVALSETLKSERFQKISEKSVVIAVSGIRQQVSAWVLVRDRVDGSLGRGVSAAVDSRFRGNDDEGKTGIH
jgi:hypothetical protein